jgi:hypothetical protein
MLYNAIFHVLNVAGGMGHDPSLWKSHFYDEALKQQINHRTNSLESLSDAAEQLRRLTRHTALKGTPAKLLADALEIVERESLVAQRKSRNIATSGLSAGGIG